MTDETGKQISRFRKNKTKKTIEKQTYIFEFRIVSEVYNWSFRDSLLFLASAKKSSMLNVHGKQGSCVTEMSACTHLAPMSSVESGQYNTTGLREPHVKR